MNSNYIIVFVTCKSKPEAEKIAHALLEEKLIACANLIAPIHSLFHWQGKVDEAEECLMVLKSRLDLFDALAERLKGLHSYEVPEILAVPVVAGSEAYLAWMGDVLK
jgi:periplasmic divalent cation tolerance protein